MTPIADTGRVIRPPDDFWREVPCGHPSDPVAWWTGQHFSCHCGKILDPARKIAVIEAYDIVQCGGCGCAVGCLPPNDSGEA